MIVVSIMRDSAEYVDRYMEQVLALRKLVGDVKVVIAEGDSADDTWGRLNEYRTFTGFTLLKVEHGGPYFPSIDNPLRWRQLASVCNVALTAAVRELEDDEPLVYVESDLIWSPETIQKLVKHLEVYPAVVPMSMYEGRFYDTWGHTKNWEPFRRNKPYFDGWSDTMMHQITSAGSCFALSWPAAQVAHFSPVDCIRGIGRTLAADGQTLWLDPTLEVIHP